MKLMSKKFSCLLISGSLSMSAYSADTVGVTATEIKLGQTSALSGPAAQYGLIARTASAYFAMINEQGGVNGRKINLIVADDEYSPPKSVEAVRKLVEQEQVALMFGSFGTPTNSAQVVYLNRLGIPHLFLATGADKWGDVKTYPWSMGFQPSFRTEAQLYTKHILQVNPQAKIGVLYQNDDFGKDYLRGVQDELGSAMAGKLVKAVSYETADPSVDSQVLMLKSSGVDVIVLAAIPKFAAQAIKKAYAMEWHPTMYLSLGASGVSTTTEPAKDKAAITLISGAFSKQARDTTWEKDPGMLKYLDFMKKYLPNEDKLDALPPVAFNTAAVIVEVLKRAGNDLSRANILKQAESLKNFELPLLLPGITVNTSASDHYPIEQVQLTRWDGKRWVPLGGILEITGTKKAH